MTTKKPLKRRVKTNVWGNTYGYEGTRRVIDFCAGDNTELWLRDPEAFNRELQEKRQAVGGPIYKFERKTL